MAAAAPSTSAASAAADTTRTTGASAGSTGPTTKRTAHNDATSAKRAAAVAATRGNGAKARAALAARQIAAADLPVACSGALTLGTVYSCVERPADRSRFTFELASATDLLFVELVSVNNRPTGVSLTASDGSAVTCSRAPGSADGTLTCPTRAAGTYSMDVTVLDDDAFSLSVSALLADGACTAVAAADTVLGAPNSFAVSLPAGSAGQCHGLPLAAGDTLRTHVTNSYVRQSVYDATATEICATDDSSREAHVDCRLTGVAPFRVRTYEPYAAAADYAFTAARLSKPAGCPVVLPQAFGTAPDTSSAARCRTLHVTAAGPYLYGPVGTGTSVSGSLYKSDGTAMCTPTLLAPCKLKAGDYTWARSPGDESSDNFGIWFHATNQAEGCTAARDDGFASGPATGAFTAAGQRLCRTLPTATGAAVHLFKQTTGGAGRPDVRVFDAKGVQQCLVEYSFAVCKLTGTAPFRMVLSGPSGSQYRLLVQRTGDTSGCLPWAQTPFGAAPGTKAQLTEDRPATCLAIGADRHATAEMFDYTNTANRNTAYVEVYDAAGDRLCGTNYSLTTTTCSFKAGTAYAAVLYGQPDTYELVRRDISATAPCKAPTSTVVGGPSTGYTFRTSLDSTCLRVTGAATDKYWFSSRTTTGDRRGALLGVVDSAGKIVCWNRGVSCRLTGSPAYTVFAMASGYAGKPISARLDTWRVGTAAGWAPECTARKVSAEGFAARSGVLTEQTTAYCAQVDIKPNQEFRVVGTDSRPYAATPWVSLLGTGSFAPGVMDGCDGENVGHFRYRCRAGSDTAGGQVLIVSPYEAALPVEYTFQGLCRSECSSPRKPAEGSSMTPAAATAGTSHLVVIRGTNLTLGTEVRLHRDVWESDSRMVEPVSVNPAGTELTVRLSTRDVRPGRYDLWLDSPNSASGVLPDAFTVTKATPTTPSRFVALTPKRILDTRSGLGAPKARIGAGKSVRLKVAGVGGVPATGVTAVVVNLTAVTPTANGYVTAWPAGTPRPDTTALSTAGGRTATASVVVPLAAGSVDLRNGAGTIDLTAEVTGYYTTDATAGAKSTALTPKRILDTRTGLGAAKARIGAGKSVRLKVAGVGGVPTAGATAVLVNLSAVRPTADGYLTAWPAGATRPDTAHLSFTTGRTGVNTVVLPLRDGAVDIRNSAGAVDLVADVTGYYSADGLRFTPTAPVRLLKTSTGLGARPGVVGAGETVSFPVSGLAGVPADAKAVTLAVTVGAPTQTSYLTASPHGGSWPGLASVQYTAGSAATNLVTLPITDGWVTLTNHAGNAHLASDLVGWYAK
ncbi:hypothetical protein ACM614_29930 [Streptomyces sp. 12297]